MFTDVIVISVAVSAQVADPPAIVITTNDDVRNAIIKTQTIRAECLGRDISATYNLETAALTVLVDNVEATLATGTIIAELTRLGPIRLAGVTCSSTNFQIGFERNGVFAGRVYGAIQTGPAVSSKKETERSRLPRQENMQRTR